MKWKKIGKILLIDKNLESTYAGRFNDLLLEHKVDTIAKIKSIDGKMRQPSIEIIAGDNSTETVHKENGCLFKLDIAKVMWSKGNTTERLRIANLVENDEVVLDMFAGIGYFLLPIAIHSDPQKIYSIEINPESYYYLNKNIDLNKINEKSNKKLGYDLIEPILGDSKLIAPKFKADRILMGYVKTTHNFLDSAIKSLNKEGIIHYHETVPEKLMNTRPVNRIKQSANDREVEILSNRIIKKYSPGVVHTVVDAKIY
ncbi:tRNA(Phe) (4-demethylwyosine(37)-C(7)) aminocarboxypropyltransferase [Candidatus Methanobinarius endosymbioticus]|uniref:tRNA(Phe) (4-demethylwyosine(37)-C(7)) aminocarboxypropyltransferase n=1 Tax=Candidatus Methanobinarius endosymbioticus TaxID=2006182 RepID=A0A366M9N9_9EURY|nr:tRNA(Phe) (4-demethylwyosine(37)-C(7)) aminocarboxypropyltransferase [Candidatus Methanobinarius endosymbioticus]